jgi:GMP synthase-like glutamine amidotransferase
MRVHWLQHAEHEELGCIAPWLAQRNFRVRRTRLHDGEPLPHTDEFDWLIVMGGPMNIYEHDRHPWLIREKKLLRDACVTDKVILGICLGAQLLADVQGGKVIQNRYQEIGWFDVSLTEEGRRNTLVAEMPAQLPVFHWHGDTFAIPPGCQNLMKSDACVNQAFALSGRRLGLQFHPELTHADALRWLAVDAPQPDRYVQPAEEMLREPVRFARMNRWMDHILGRLAGA